jgi:hypothetical protein
VLYARVPIATHTETWEIGGTNEHLRSWLTWAFDKATGKPPRPASVQSAVTLLEGRARFESPVTEVYTRLGSCDGKLYLDLSDAGWRAVEIGGDGWRVITDPPVAFRRPCAQMALPEPIPGGDVEDLRALVRVESNGDWMLMLSWLIMTLHPHGPYPVLLLQGQQGSGKSWVTRVLRQLVDPRAVPTREVPRDSRDLAVGAHNSFVLAFDNLSFLPSWLSDGFCRISTGSGFETRALYTNADQFVTYVKRPIIANAIAEIATRGDLIDRSILLNLPAMDVGEGKPERELDRLFTQLHASMLGGLLDIVSRCLRNLPNVHVPNPPRMADYVEWTWAACPALEWDEEEFLEAYEGNRMDAVETMLDASLVAQVVIRFMASIADTTLPQDPVRWKGTASELLSYLTDRVSEADTRKQGWPADATRLSAALTRIAPALKSKRITIERDRAPKDEGRRRIITLEFFRP